MSILFIITRRAPPDGGICVKTRPAHELCDNINISYNIRLEYLCYYFIILIYDRIPFRAYFVLIWNYLTGASLIV